MAHLEALDSPMTTKYRTPFAEIVLYYPTPCCRPGRGFREIGFRLDVGWLPLERSRKHCEPLPVSY